MKETRKRKLVRLRSLEEQAAKEKELSKKQHTVPLMLPTTRSDYDDVNAALQQSWQELQSYQQQEQQQQTSPPALLVSFSTPQIAQGCLLLPVGLAFWWYWTKRTARRVIKHLLPSSCSSNTTNNETTAATTAREGHLGGSSAAMACSSNSGQRFAENDDSDGIYVSASESREHQQHYHQEEAEEKVCSGSFSSESFDPFESWEDVVIEQDRRSNHLRLVQWIKGRNHFGTTRRMRAISKQTLHRRQKRSYTKKNNNSTPSNVGDDDCLRQRSIPMLNTSESSASSEKNHQCRPERPRTPHDWQCIEDVTGFELCETDYLQQQKQQQQLNGQPSSASKEGTHGNSCYGCPTT